MQQHGANAPQLVSVLAQSVVICPNLSCRGYAATVLAIYLSIIQS